MNIVNCTSAAFWQSFSVASSVLFLFVSFAIAVNLYANWVRQNDLSYRPFAFVVSSLLFAIAAGGSDAAGTFRAVACAL